MSKIVARTLILRFPNYASGILYYYQHAIPECISLPFLGDDDDYFPAMLDSVMKGLQRKSYYYYYYYMVSSANAVYPVCKKGAFRVPLLDFRIHSTMVVPLLLCLVR